MARVLQHAQRHRRQDVVTPSDARHHLLKVHAALPVRARGAGAALVFQLDTSQQRGAAATEVRPRRGDGVGAVDLRDGLAAARRCLRQRLRGKHGGAEAKSVKQLMDSNINFFFPEGLVIFEVAVQMRRRKVDLADRRAAGRIGLARSCPRDRRGARDGRGGDEHDDVGVARAGAHVRGRDREGAGAADGSRRGLDGRRRLIHLQRVLQHSQRGGKDFVDERVILGRVEDGLGRARDGRAQKIGNAPRGSGAEATRRREVVGAKADAEVADRLGMSEAATNSFWVFET